MRQLNTPAEFEEAMVYSSSGGTGCAGSPRTVVVDFFADWCGPCKMLAPEFEAMSQEEEWTTGGVLFAKVNTDLNKVVAQQQGITALPTLKVYVNRNCVATIVGPRMAELRTALRTHYVAPRDPSLEELASSNPVEVFNEARRVLLRIADNILDHPLNEKYRSVKLTNQIVERTLLPCAGALQCLYAMGFQDAEDQFKLAASAPLTPLRQIRSQLADLKLNTSNNNNNGAGTVGVAGPSATLAPLSTVDDAVSGSRQAPQASMSIANAPKSASISPANEQAFLAKVLSTHSHMLIYNDVKLQTQARTLMNLPERLKQARSNSIEDLVRELLRWFKQHFFTWMDKPNCDKCQVQCNTLGSTSPTDEDTRWWASRIELYACPGCGDMVRFPRYNHPGRLLVTRTGRCGEWANCFTLILTAAGVPARYVLDWTDHVWCEVRVPTPGTSTTPLPPAAATANIQCDVEANAIASSVQRADQEYSWLHCDPCEEVLDTPLLYEAGWGKKLSYVIAFTVGSRAIQDVTWRYTANFMEILQRRCEIRESAFTSFLLRNHRSVIGQLEQSGTAIEAYRREIVSELVQFLSPARVSKNPAETQGRTTGSEEWRKQRGEMGTENRGTVLLPTEAEMTSGEIYLRYNCAKDEYERGPPRANPRYDTLGTGGRQRSTDRDTSAAGASAGSESNKEDSNDTIEIHRGWQSQAASWENIVRKSERDWKMVYLSREEGSPADREGQLTWTVDLSSVGRVVNEVKVFANGAIFEAAKFSFQLFGDNGLCLPVNGFLTTRDLCGCRRVRLKATLWGGTGPVAWQQAQLCRQRDTDTETFPLVFVVSMQSEDACSQTQSDFSVTDSSSVGDCQ